MQVRFGQSQAPGDSMNKLFCYVYESVKFMSYIIWFPTLRNVTMFFSILAIQFFDSDNESRVLWQCFEDRSYLNNFFHLL